MNKELQFTATTARNLASNRMSMITKNNEALLNNIVEYIKSKYPGEIQKAIDNNVHCESIDIKLPKIYRKALRSLSDDELSVMKENFHLRFTDSGFNVRLQNGSWSCSEGCPLKYLGCTKYFNVYIGWGY